MNYKIEFSRSAEKELTNIPRTELKKIVHKIEKLSKDPFLYGYEKLKGSNDLYRIRQGDYRIIYTVFEKKCIILIVKIGNRREVYR